MNTGSSVLRRKSHEFTFSVIKSSIAVVSAVVVAVYRVFAQYHVSSSDIICVAEPVYLLVNQLHELSRLLDGAYLFDGSVYVLYIDDNGAAAEDTLTEGKNELLIADAVEVEFVLLDGKKALSGDEFLLGEKISCK